MSYYIANVIDTYDDDSDIYGGIISGGIVQGGYESFLGGLGVTEDTDSEADLDESQEEDPKEDPKENKPKKGSVVFDDDPDLEEEESPLAEISDEHEEQTIEQILNMDEPDDEHRDIDLNGDPAIESFDTHEDENDGPIEYPESDAEPGDMDVLPEDDSLDNSPKEDHTEEVSLDVQKQEKSKKQKKSKSGYLEPVGGHDSNSESDEDDTSSDDTSSSSESDEEQFGVETDIADDTEDNAEPPKEPVSKEEEVAEIFGVEADHAEEEAANDESNDESNDEEPFGVEDADENEPSLKKPQLEPRKDNLETDDEEADISGGNTFGSALREYL